MFPFDDVIIKYIHIIGGASPEAIVLTSIAWALPFRKLSYIVRAGKVNQFVPDNGLREGSMLRNFMVHIDGLIQKRRNSSALAMLGLSYRYNTFNV